MRRQQIDEPLDNEVDEAEDFCYTEDEAKADFEYLKSAVVNTANLPTIKEKLMLTSEYRFKILSDPSNDLLVNFPYFFINVDLVSERFAS